MIGINNSKVDEIYNDCILYLYNEVISRGLVQQTVEEFEKSLREDISITDSHNLEEVVDQFVQPLFLPSVNHEMNAWEEKENVESQAVNFGVPTSAHIGKKIFKVQSSAVLQDITKLSKSAIRKRTSEKKEDTNKILAPAIRAKNIKWSPEEVELLLEGIKEFGCHWKKISIEKQLSHVGLSCSVKFQHLKQKGDPRLLAILSNPHFNKDMGISTIK